MANLRSKLKSVRRHQVSVLLICLTTSIFFQNCGKGFRISTSGSTQLSSESGADSNTPDVPGPNCKLRLDAAIPGSELGSVSFANGVISAKGDCTVINVPIVLKAAAMEDITIEYQIDYNPANLENRRDVVAKTTLIRTGESSIKVPVDLRAGSNVKTISMILKEVNDGRIALGRMNTIDILLTEPASLTTDSFKQFSGYIRGCFMAFNGSVKCLDAMGNLQVVAGLTDVKSISGRCALINDGTVKCWGGYDSNVPGTVPFTAVVVPGLTNIVKISATSNMICGINMTNQVFCSYGGPATQIPGISTAVDVIGATFGGCASLQDQTLSCWNSSSNSDSGLVGVTATTMAGVTGVKSLSSSYWSFCAVVANGDVYCWGREHLGIIGTGDLLPKTVPTKVVGVSNATSVSMGARLACAIQADGVVKCWGGGGRAGTPITNSLSLATTVTELAGASKIHIPEFHLCAEFADKRFRCSGTALPRYLDTVQLPIAASAVADVSSVKSLFLDDEQVCVSREQGPTECWGGSGHLPHVDLRFQNMDQFFVQNAGVGGVRCAVMRDKTVKCWANSQYANSYGQVGRITPEAAQDIRTPTTVTGLSNAVSIAVTPNVTCALDSLRKVYCWGFSIYLGDGSSTTAPFSAVTTPRAVQIPEDMVAIFDAPFRLRYGHAVCSVGVSGKIYCWSAALTANVGGTNFYRPVEMTGAAGLKGLVTTGESTYALVGNSLSLISEGPGPGQISVSTTPFLAGVKSISGTCALMLNGTVQCWGRNTSGTLGRSPALGDSATPVVIPGATDVREVFATSYSTYCVIHNNGTTSCWGGAGPMRGFRDAYTMKSLIPFYGAL